MSRAGPRIAVLDYGIGNLRSAEKALQHVGAAARLVTDPAEVEAADAVVLPGVGAFGACARALHDSGLGAAARGAIAAGVPFLAVCIGFQLLYEGSDESPGAAGLGVFAGQSALLAPTEKHPQMQWNQLEIVGQPRDGSVPVPAPLRGLGERPWVYFVHSYAPPVGAETVAVCDYGGPVAALVAEGNVWGAQFHPEKSGRSGLALLANFVALGCVILYPAIDLRRGGAVRLAQGDFARETRYGDPLALAATFVGGGASWIHVVDLEAARTGVPHERALLARIVEVAGAGGARVQTGGGIRTEDDVAVVLDLGVSRVVLGTAALEQPALAARCARRWPGQVAVGLDYVVRPDGVAEALGHGWQHGTGRVLGELLALWGHEPIGAVVATAITRDGMLEGPDLAGMRELLGLTTLPVVASGGVGTLDDLADLAGLAVEGVIVGKALVEGRFSVEEAVAACAASV